VRISVVVVAFRSGEALPRCLRSIRGQAPEVEVIVVDNGGGAGEAVAAEGREQVRLIAPGKNLGFAGGCNLGAAEANGDVLVFLNPDTVVAPGALQQLAKMVESPDVGIAMARLRLLDRPELLNSSGTVVHICGLAWAGGYGEPADSVDAVKDVAAPSGAAMAIRSALFTELGGFTSELFAYLEDVELGWRARIHGLRVVVDPDADVYHDYEFGRHPDKLALLERNRLVFVLSAYSLRLILLLAPVLVIFELGMLAVATRQRWLRGKLRGWSWCVAHAGWLGRHRRQTQELRRVGDRELAKLLTPIADPKMMPLPGGASFVNRAFAVYWALVQRAL